MSADNFVGVRPNKNGTYSIFEYGCASVDEEDCMYLSDDMGEIQPTREEALVRAHDIMHEMDICEYGVQEMSPVPEVPCGSCYVCINIRGIVSTTVPLCTECEKPISNSDWQVHTQGGIFHNACEPGRG